MRHGKKINHLGRTAPHRKAMLANMANSLIEHKRIVTTVAKAKALRKYIEPILTKSKTDTTHSRRQVFSKLRSKESLKILFDEISQRIADRPGGYTRILRLGNRKGDNAEIAMIELVDYNAAALETKTTRKRTRRSGKASPGASAEATAETAVVTEEVIAEESSDAAADEGNEKKAGE